MMMHVMLSAPRPSLWARLAGQLFSIIISTTVAKPLYLLLSIGASSFAVALFVVFFCEGTPAGFTPDLAPELEVVLVNFKLVGLY